MVMSQERQCFVLDRFKRTVMMRGDATLCLVCSGGVVSLSPMELIDEEHTAVHVEEALTARVVDASETKLLLYCEAERARKLPAARRALNVEKNTCHLFPCRGRLDFVCVVF